MGWLKKAFDFVAGSQLMQMILGLLGALLAFKAVQWKARMDGEAAERKRWQKKMSDENAAVNETRREITQENQDAVKRADDAINDLPGYTSAGELRERNPGVGEIVLGPRP